MTSTRQARVADQIKEIVAQMINTKLKDPRLGMVTITDARITGDLQNATVFYTVYGSDHDVTQSGRALESAKGMIRSAVGKQLGFRLTPTLAFELDALPQSSQSIEDALAAARFHDEQVRKLAEGASYAGDADPYKKPREIDAEPDADSNDYAELPSGAHALAEPEDDTRPDGDLVAPAGALGDDGRDTASAQSAENA